MTLRQQLTHQLDQRHQAGRHHIQAAQARIDAAEALETSLQALGIRAIALGNFLIDGLAIALLAKAQPERVRQTLHAIGINHQAHPARYPDGLVRITCQHPIGPVTLYVDPQEATPCPATA